MSGLKTIHLNVEKAYLHKDYEIIQNGGRDEYINGEGYICMKEPGATLIVKDIAPEYGVHEKAVIIYHSPNREPLEKYTPHKLSHITEKNWRQHYREILNT